MKIRIGFSTSSAWYSRLIRWATKAKCSHTFLVIDTAGVPLVFEEGVFGYSVRTLSNMRASGSTIVEMYEPKWPIDAAVRGSFQWLGQRYDYAGLFGMTFVEIARFFRHKRRNFLASKHAMFCSEEVTRVLQASGFPGSKQMTASTTDPEMLRRFVSASKWAKPCGVQP